MKGFQTTPKIGGCGLRMGRSIDGKKIDNFLVSIWTWLSFRHRKAFKTNWCRWTKVARTGFKSSKISPKKFISYWMIPGGRSLWMLF